MATITINEVGLFRCKFKEINPCKNENYCMVGVYFEGIFDGRICDWNSVSRPQYLLHKADEIDHLAQMQANHVYLLKMSIGHKNASQKDGKSYQAGVDYKILEVVKEVS